MNQDGRHDLSSSQRWQLSQWRTVIVQMPGWTTKAPPLPTVTRVWYTNRDSAEQYLATADMDNLSALPGQYPDNVPEHQLMRLSP